MPRLRVLVGLTTVSLTGAVGFVPTAHASGYDWALNGRYLVTSNGDWAKSNEVFHDEWTVRQVWDVETTCTGPTTCTSQLTSSQGWSAPVRFTGSQWIVDRVLPDWQPCQDGTKSPGHQKFRFDPVDSNGQAVPGDGSIFAGVDQTDGVSGACGKNLPLVIRLPLRLQRTL